jgi:hypothetical protein
MGRDWARTVAGLAAARLERPLCSCSQAFGDRMKSDRAHASSGTSSSSSFQISPSDLDNPFGTRLGEIMAWKHVKRRGIVMSRGGMVA